MRPTHTRSDFDHSPMIVFYETTRACDLACKHCRADAQRDRDPRELSMVAAMRMIADDRAQVENPSRRIPLARRSDRGRLSPRTRG